MFNNKKLIIGLCIGILVFTLIGGTFAYFTASATATGDAISGSTNGDIALEVTVNKITFEGAASSNSLVPSNIEATADSVGNAISNNCEASGYTGCHLYEITASSTQTIAHANINLDSLSVDSTDKESWKYVIYTGSTSTVTALVDGGSGSFDLDESFDMHDGAGLTANTPVKYYLLIYIANSSSSQNSGDESDVTGDYSGEVSITAAGGKVEASLKPKPVSFSTDSWEMIANNTTSTVYKVGDTKCVALTGFTTTNDNGCDNGEFLVRIANKSTPEECSGEDFSQTACGFVVEFVDIIAKHNMNSTATNVGSWPASMMYTYVNNTIYNALPSDVRAKIINTKSVTGYGTNDSTNFISNSDKLYLLSLTEVIGDEILYCTNYKKNVHLDSAYDASRQLDYYQEEGVTDSNYGELVKQYNGKNTEWWLRTPDFCNNRNFYYNSGSCYSTEAYSVKGVVVAFRIG